jgi:hypothetical protein
MDVPSLNKGEISTTRLTREWDNQLLGKSEDSEETEDEDTVEEDTDEENVEPRIFQGPRVRNLGSTHRTA